jgi:cysteine desulfurase
LPRVYLDHVASTPVLPEARDAVARTLATAGANPSSPHLEGRAAKDALEEARTRVAAVLGCRPREVVFTSGGTESLEIAVRGVAAARRGTSPRVVLSAAEHPAVRLPAADLRGAGFEVVEVRIGPDGRVDPEELLRATEPGAAVAALLLASHESGAVQPVAPVARALRERRIPLLTDACLGVGRLPVRPDDLGVDLLALSGHKFGAPQGIGVLFVRRRTPIAPWRAGGLQEERLRPGTENVAGAVGLAVALERADGERDERARRYRALDDAFLAAAASSDGWRRLGPTEERLPGLLTLEMPGVEGEAAMINLDLEGFAVATGSTCALGGTDVSPGLIAMGLSASRAASTVRVSFGEGNSTQDASRAGAAFARVVARLRALARG